MKDYKFYQYVLENDDLGPSMNNQFKLLCFANDPTIVFDGPFELDIT